VNIPKTFPPAASSLLVLTLSFALGAGCATAGDEAAAVAKVAPRESPRAHDFTYEDINPASPSFGQRLTLKDLYAEQGLVLNFVASWCGPCWHEVPGLMKVAKQVATPVVCVAADEYGPPSDLLSRAASAQLNLPIVLVPADEIEDMGLHYDHELLPTTYWIDKQGQIVERRQGALSATDLFNTTQKNFPAPSR